MGQKIFYVIIPSKIKIPINIVHFQENNGTVLPLLIDANDFKKIITIGEYSNNVKDFFDSLTFSQYEYPTRKVFNFIKKSKIESFGLIGYREILEIPQNLVVPILFINGEKQKIGSSREAFIHKELGIDFSFSELLKNENRYWSYASSERD